VRIISLRMLCIVIFRTISLKITTDIPVDRVTERFAKVSFNKNA